MARTSVSRTLAVALAALSLLCGPGHAAADCYGAGCGCYGGGCRRGQFYGGVTPYFCAQQRAAARRLFGSLCDALPC